MGLELVTRYFTVNTVRVTVFHSYRIMLNVCKMNCILRQNFGGFAFHKAFFGLFHWQSIFWVVQKYPTVLIPKVLSFVFSVAKYFFVVQKYPTVMIPVCRHSKSIPGTKSQHKTCVYFENFSFNTVRVTVFHSYRIMLNVCKMNCILRQNYGGFAFYKAFFGLFHWQSIFWVVQKYPTVLIPKVLSFVFSVAKYFLSYRSTLL